MARANKLAKAAAVSKGKAGASSKPSNLTQKAKPLSRSPPRRVEATVSDASIEEVVPVPKAKRPAVAAPSSPAPPLKKGKKAGKEINTIDEDYGLKMDDLKKLSIDEVNEMYSLPKMPARRAPGISNEHSVIQEPASIETYRAFRSILFARDQEYLGDLSSPVIAQCASYHFTCLGNMLYHIFHRERLRTDEATEWSKKYEDEVKSGARAELEIAQERVAIAESENESLKKRMAELESEVGRIHNEMKAEQEEKAFLSRDNFDLRRKAKDLTVQLQDVGMKAHEAGFMEGREFEAKLDPQKRLGAVEEFVRSPVFEMATLVMGASDLQSGFDRAKGQIKALGVDFDESKLDPALDEDLKPVDDDEDDDMPEVEGHEFESVLEIVQGLADIQSAKDEASRERRRKVSETLPLSVSPLRQVPLPVGEVLPEVDTVVDIGESAAAEIAPPTEGEIAASCEELPTENIDLVDPDVVADT